MAKMKRNHAEKMTEVVRKDAFAKLLGIQILAVRPGYSKVQMKVTRHHLNGLGSIQGGVLFTLADYAFAAASNTPGFTTVGINSNISFYERPEGDTLEAECKALSRKKRITGYQVSVRDKRRTVVAHMNALGYTWTN
jgi:acyl-CoA thioesterase